MTNQELTSKIRQLERDLEELEADLYYTRFNVTQEVIKKEIKTIEHVLKQYKEMVK